MIKVTKFYAPWCSQCKELKPILDNVKSKYENNPDVVFEEINADLNMDMCDKYGIESLPVILIEKDSDINPIKIEGLRTAKDICSMIDEKLS